MKTFHAQVSEAVSMVTVYTHVCEASAAEQAQRWRGSTADALDTHCRVERGKGKRNE